MRPRTRCTRRAGTCTSCSSARSCRRCGSGSSSASRRRQCDGSSRARWWRWVADAEQTGSTDLDEEKCMNGPTFTDSTAALRPIAVTAPAGAALARLRLDPRVRQKYETIEGDADEAHVIVLALT